LPEIKKTGASLIAISPMLVKYTPQLVHKLNLKFPVLSDPGQLFLEQLGVVFSLPSELIEVYKGFGIDLKRFNGDDTWRLPLPGQIIVNRDGIVRTVELSTDHTQRPEPTEALKLLKTMT
jgi:peroxiredoxin